MIGMRDKLIHDYIGVDLSVVWKTIQEDVPEIEEDIRKIIDIEKWYYWQNPTRWSEALNEGVNFLLMLIKESPGRRTPFYSKNMGTFGKNVERWIKQLKEEDKIEFRGAAKTGGYYVSE